MVAFRGHTKSFKHLFDMWLSTLEISAAHLRSMTEIALKLPFLYVLLRNRPFRVWLLSCQKCVWVPVTSMISGNFPRKSWLIFLLPLEISVTVYPGSRGPFSKYLRGNIVCSRFDLAPETDVVFSIGSEFAPCWRVFTANYQYLSVSIRKKKNSWLHKTTRSTL